MAFQTSGSKILLSWKFPEFPIYQRGTNWYIWMGLVGGALIIYAIITANFLFAIILVLGALILFVRSHGQPRAIEFTITDMGLSVGETFYPYKEIKNFWIVYEPPEVKSLYIDLRSAFRPHLLIPLEDEDPVKIRKILLKYIVEDTDRDTEPLADQISRLLKM